MYQLNSFKLVWIKFVFAGKLSVRMVSLSAIRKNGSYEKAFCKRSFEKREEKGIACLKRDEYAERREAKKLDQGACAFTGHRPAHFSFGYQEDHPDCVRIKNAIGLAISALAEEGVTTFISGMAQGVDLWAAREVLRQREKREALRLIAVQPYTGQADRWPESFRDAYNEILMASDERLCLHPAYTPSCMMERNRWMVDHAEILLAVYDGSASGGTAATVRYAQSKKREIWLLDPKTLLLAQLKPPEEDEQLSF